MKTINIKTNRGFIQAVSGLFITKRNPTGLSPREIDVLTALIYYLKGERQVTTEVKKDLSVLLEQPIQVVTNYLKKFRDKKILNEENVINSIFLEKKILILRDE